MQIIGKHPFLLFCCHFPQNSRWTKTSYQESISLSAHFSKFPSVSVRIGKRREIMVIAGFNARADRQTHSCVLHTRVHTHAHKLLHLLPQQESLQSGSFLPRVFLELRGSDLGKSSEGILQKQNHLYLRAASVCAFVGPLLLVWITSVIWTQDLLCAASAANQTSAPPSLLLGWEIAPSDGAVPNIRGLQCLHLSAPGIRTRNQSWGLWH